MATKSKSYWRQKIQQSISSRNPAMDVEFGPTYDIAVKPLGDVLEEVSMDIEAVARITDLSRWQEWADDEVEMIAANYGLTRRGGTFATGTATFYAVKKPTVNVVIPRNTVVSTLDGIKFVVTARVEVTLAAIGGYKNLTTGRYEVPAFIEALEAGSSGVIAGGSIVRIEGSGVLGVTSVVNKASTVGGSDVETNEELVTRIRMLMQGGIGGTSENGLKLKLLQAFEGQVRSVEIEPEFPIIDGTIDIWIIGSNIADDSVITYWFERDIVIGKGPVFDVTDVSSGATTYIKDVDWTLVKDYISAQARTSQAKDLIRWLSLTKPGFGAEVTIQYSRNKLLDDIEAWASKEYNIVTGLDIVYREGIPISVEVEATVVVETGFEVSEVKSKVKTALSDYINDRGLGESLELSDLIYVTKEVAGVDNIIFTKLCELGGSGVADLTVPKSKYFVVDLGDILIS